MKKGMRDTVELGALDTVRDWSYAGDIVEAMWLMLDADEPDDYVLASGKLHAVSDILDIAFDHVGLDWHHHVKINESFKRPSEGLPLCGDSGKARDKLGWSPKMDFESMIRMMVDKDLERLK
jgi:GDPmannose 4,6-dehydratase